MRTAEVTIVNKSGLHARPAAMFCRQAIKWTSSVQLENLTRAAGPVDAKRLISVISLGVEAGHKVRLSVDGADETAALADLLDSIKSGLGEGA
jgi:phosphotransferase system HPr (HPr) family protein